MFMVMRRRRLPERKGRKSSGVVVLMSSSSHGAGGSFNLQGREHPRVVTTRQPDAFDYACGPSTNRARSRRSISNGVMTVTPRAMHASGILILFVEFEGRSCVTTTCPWASPCATRKQSAFERNKFTAAASYRWLAAHALTFASDASSA